MASADTSTIATRKRMRASHTKSRHGCFACKNRKVKCDEVKPVCGSCSARGMSCDFPVDPPGPGPPRGRASAARGTGKETREPRGPSQRIVGERSAMSSAPASPHPLQFALREPSVYPTGSDTGSLNMIDLQLLSHFMAHTSKNMSLNPPKQRAWETVIPALAARVEYVMHLQLALAGLDYFYTEHVSPAGMADSHLQAVIRHHQRGLEGFRNELGSLSNENAHHVFAGALLLVAFAFASLRIRNLDELDCGNGQRQLIVARPRLDWIYLIRGLTSVLRHHWQELRLGSLRVMTQFKYATDDWQSYPQEMFHANAFPDQRSLGTGRISRFCRGACDAIVRIRAYHASISAPDLADRGTPARYGSQGQALCEQRDAIDILEQMYMRILFVARHERDDAQSGLAMQADMEEAAVMGWPETLSKGFLETLDDNDPIANFSWVVLAYLYGVFCLLDGYWFLRGAFGEEIMKINNLIHVSGIVDLDTLMQWPVSLVAV
ncbi:Zn(II)2Cys6 transcription factor [Aspergillus undulatus]|uniref:Zn(II)2Cys6 transcription factor n=1 Tax=Aspergillus undulatus TaxID=1810928 RepID=UPI003CCE30E8